MSLDFGKSGGTTVTTPELTPEQRADIANKAQTYSEVIAPAIRGGVQGVTSLYNQAAPGVTNAAQNLAQTAGQVQETLGGTGESATRTGISGLEGLFGNDYEQQQLQAALAPAQAQYQQNLAGLQAGFGGAGQIGSARQALAQTQLAGQTQASQQQAAAKILADIAGQRAGVGQFLAQQGASNLGQSLGAAGQATTAAQIPLDFINKYIAGWTGSAPSAGYTPDYRGTQGSTVSKSDYKAGGSSGIF
jgi:hypothetical protein